MISIFSSQHCKGEANPNLNNLQIVFKDYFNILIHVTLKDIFPAVKSAVLQNKIQEYLKTL